MLTPDQQQQALHARLRANEVRAARSTLRREIADLARDEGKRRAAQVIADPAPDLRSLPVGGLLGYIRRFGTGYSRKLCGRIPVSELKPIGDLTPRQRDALIVALGGEVTARAGTEAPAPRPAAARIARPPAPAPSPVLAAAPSPTDWCPQCDSEVVVDDDTRRCLWCRTPTTRKAIAA